MPERLIRFGAWLGLLLLTSCSTLPPPRPYFEEDSKARYYLTHKDEILRVETDGTVLNVTCLPPSMVKGFSKKAVLEMPCVSGTPKVIGTVRKSGEEWDMKGYDVVPETGTCKSLFAALRNDWLEEKRESCWHRVWEVPAAVVFYPGVAGIALAVITAPIWVPILLF